MELVSSLALAAKSMSRPREKKGPPTNTDGGNSLSIFSLLNFPRQQLALSHLLIPSFPHSLILLFWWYLRIIDNRFSPSSTRFNRRPVRNPLATPRHIGPVNQNQNTQPDPPSLGERTTATILRLFLNTRLPNDHIRLCNQETELVRPNRPLQPWHSTC